MPRRCASRVYVIAEIGVNHGGNPAVAAELLRAAATAGADAAKLQLYVPEEIAVPGPHRDMLSALRLPDDAIARLVADAPLPVFASVFDASSARQAVALGLPALKLGSGEVTNAPLHEVVCAIGLPTIVSVGMATFGEIMTVVELYAGRGVPLMLMHCVSAYPAPEAEANLRTISWLRRMTSCEVGYSDHTCGETAAQLAVALGAVAIECHLTLDARAPGPDNSTSLEPAEFARYVQAVRRAETVLGVECKAVAQCERATRERAQRSLTLRAAVSAGTVLTRDLVACLRPSGGLPPAALAATLGRRAARDMPAWHQLQAGDIA